MSQAVQTRARSWLLLLASWLLAVTILALWLGRTPIADLRDDLTTLQFWFLEIGAVVLLALSSLELPRLLRSLDIPRRAWINVAATAVLAGALTAFVAPRTNRIYYDEHIYQNIGQNMADLRQAQMCNEGTVEYGRLACARGEYNKQPYGFPYLLSVGYRIFGVGDALAARLNSACAMLLPPLVFLTAYLLFGDLGAAQYAALVSALVPQQLLWSNTASAEPTAAFFCLVAVLAALSFVRQPTTGTLLWMTAATSFASQFRPESLLCIPLVALIVTLRSPREWTRPRWWWAGLLGLMLCAALVGHLVAVRQEGWGASDVRLGWRFVMENLSVNGPFYFANDRFPALFTILALIGVVLSRNLGASLIGLVYFMLFWGVFLFFYAGSYDYGADVRYSLMTYPPLAILAGAGASAVARISARWAPRPHLVDRAVTGVVFVAFLQFMPLVRAIGEEAWAARADVRVAREFARMLPSNSIILTHNPSMFLVWGRNAAQASLATTDESWVRQVVPLRYGGGIYFHWNFWCNVADPAQNAFCQNVLARYPTKLIAERHERGYRYALYRIE